MANSKPNFTVVGDTSLNPRQHLKAFVKEMEARNKQKAAEQEGEGLNKESTALIRIDTMEPREALRQHVQVKEGGKGAIVNFVQNETVYPAYGQYYYQLKKLGVVPFRKEGVATEAPEVRYEPTLEEQVLELKRQLAAAKMSPAKRAVEVLYGQFDSLGTRSRSFLCTIIAHDRAHLTAKQEKWLSDLENRTV